MMTLQADIDDLDRMIDTGAVKDAVRSQIRLIAREVATLHADFENLEQHHAQFREPAEKVILELNAKPAGKKVTEHKRTDDWFREQAQKLAEFRKRHTLSQ